MKKIYLLVIIINYFTKNKTEIMENLLKEKEKKELERKNLFWINLLNKKREFNNCLYERTWKLGLCITKKEQILYNKNKELKNENEELKNKNEELKNENLKNEKLINKELKNENEELKKIISKILNKSIIELFDEKEKEILNNLITGKKRKNNFDE
jgi:hypothetical protein